jgi:plastocyanin
LLVIAATLLAATVIAGCSNSQKVGEGLGVNGSTATTACRLGECATTTAPSAAPSPPTTTTTKATAAAGARAGAATTTIAAARPTTTAPAQAAVFVIRIQGDSAGGQFQPSQAGVTRGTTVRWTNADSSPRSVEADDGSFTSPELAPGASFDLVATTAGKFPYHDGTRPYAVATLQVA